MWKNNLLNPVSSPRIDAGWTKQEVKRLMKWALRNAPLILTVITVSCAVASMVHPGLAHSNCSVHNSGLRYFHL